MTPIEIDPLTGAPVIKTPSTVQSHAPLPFTPPALNHDVNKSQTESGHEKEIDPTLTNLIEEAKKRNASLTPSKPETDNSHKLLQIRAALSNSGADSMQQAKTYERIKEILGW